MTFFNCSLFNKLLFKAWCVFVTILHQIFRTVTKDDQGMFYLHLENVVIGLIPTTTRFSFLQYRASVFVKEKKYIKPAEKMLARLESRFRHDLRLKNMYIIIDDQSPTVKLLKYDLEKGFVSTKPDAEYAIEQLIKSESRSKNSTNAKFYFPILVS